jgi:hypothetical protein
MIVSRLVKCGFARRKAVKLGAYIGHAPRDHHAPYVGGGLTRFQDAHDAQWSAG